MTTIDNYLQFVRSKVTFDHMYGLPPNSIHPHVALKPHQKTSVRWALEGGRRAIFASFGLGKSAVQLDICRIINQVGGGWQLIVCPLGVKGEFRRDAERILKIEPPRYVRRTSELDAPGTYITNYESVRDGRLDVSRFQTVCLDEAAILRNFGSKTSQNFGLAFAHTKWRFAATATPSPNEYRELFEYAHFLGVMDRGQAMTRWTKRDSTKANNLRLLPNMEHEFWLWVASWGLFLTHPSEICADKCATPRQKETML